MKNSKKNGKKESHVTKEKKRNLLAERNVKRANRLSDPLSELPDFKVYCKNELNLELECKKVRDLDTGTVDGLFNLLKKNMEQLYRNCDWGWDDKKKLSQMTEPAAWYLIARDEAKTPVAFSHFRFDMDYGVDVLYLYELQLEESVRRKGLGKFMSETIELIAFKNNMKKVVLTCFKHNPEAIEFYKSMNFKVDCTSPEDEESFCYYILSKPNIHLETTGS
ncbi:N-alpha-acetyltransferase 40 [Halyomorpha halys]|uniref:N-alpha-acetyltransferase 40 n=1 Tax=Halyomorpha halys TaxID=286706 RepID=UPI0006D51198|nr:N-alpha-acetyltransferase 40 [Halyomorpha halys]